MKLRVHERLLGLQPRHAYGRWRDELVHRAALLPQVRDLRERERAASGNQLHRRLQWALEVELPLVARAFVPADALLFELAETWDEAALGCDWSLRSLGFPPDTARASGQMLFSGDGLHVEGEVRIDPAAVPQMARATAPALERVLALAIERGYRELAASIA